MTQNRAEKFMFYNITRLPATHKFLSSFVTVVIPLFLVEFPLFKSLIAPACMKTNQCETLKRNIVDGVLLEDNFEHFRGGNYTRL